MTWGSLDNDIPEEIIIGNGTVMYISGWAYSPGRTISGVCFSVNGYQQKMNKIRIPRIDLLPHVMQLGGVGKPDHDNAVRSGFAGYLSFGKEFPREQQTARLTVEFTDGGSATIWSQDIAFKESFSFCTSTKGQRVWEGTDPPVVVCMTTYNPRRDSFTRQIDSIRSQEYRNWSCLISDDASRSENLEMIRQVVGGDDRFFLLTSHQNRGFYRNYEHVLRFVPEDARYVALSDQDDCWYPDKLSSCVAFLEANPEHGLVYSDMRIVADSGEVTSETYWKTRKNNYLDLDTLLIANTVTGAATVFRRELVEDILPFPQELGQVFHDHVIACTALAKGPIGYIDRPLFDYIQYAESVIGHCDFPKPERGLKRTFRTFQSLIKALAGWKRFKRSFQGLPSVYHFEYVRLAVMSKTLALRLGSENEALKILDDSRDTTRKLRQLHRRIIKRGQTTNNAEIRLANGVMARNIFERFIPAYLLISRAVAAMAWPWRVLRYPRSSLAGNRLARGVYKRLIDPGPLDRVRAIEEKISPLTVQTDKSKPVRVNFIIPEINPRTFFGGYIGKFNLMKKLVQRGHAVRCLIVDRCDMDRTAWQEKIFSRNPDLEDILDKVETVDCSDRFWPVVFNPEDSVLATTWWTAHIADSLLKHLSRDKFIYLIQEFEPFTFPMGTYFSLARKSYDFPHHALFSTTFLRDYFQENRIGVFANADSKGSFEYFNNAILRFDPPVRQVRESDKKKLLFYARPEPHAARNMFETGYMALCHAIEDGILDDRWELFSMGTDAGDIVLPNGSKIKMLGKQDMDGYKKLLPEFELGLSLMYTPHPSLVPLEMAAAGQLVVTNSCLNKTREQMEALSPNLICVEPSIEGVWEGIRAAVERSTKSGTRLINNVAWPADWSDALGDSLMDSICSWL